MAVRRRSNYKYDWLKYTRVVPALGLFFAIGFFHFRNKVFSNVADSSNTKVEVHHMTEHHDDYVIHAPWGDKDIVIHTYPVWNNMKIFKHLDTLENLQNPKDMPEDYAIHYPIHKNRMPLEPLALHEYPSITNLTIYN